MLEVPSAVWFNSKIWVFFQTPADNSTLSSGSGLLGYFTYTETTSGNTWTYYPPNPRDETPANFPQSVVLELTPDEYEVLNAAVEAE